MAGKKLTLKRAILFVITYILTGVIRFTIIFFPFKYLAKLIGKESVSYDTTFELSCKQVRRIKAIQWAVQSASRRTLWKSLCMVQALTAMSLLKLYRIPSKLYLGINKEKDTGSIIAHAWLQVACSIITGGEEARKFSVVTWFVG